MSYTNFPNGVTSMGIPAHAGLPMIRGQWYFVEPVTGSDGNSGKELKKPFLTFAKAYDACTSSAGDGICVLNKDTGTTSTNTLYVAAELDWIKCGITVFGVCAPTMFGQRSRLANTTTVLTIPQIIHMSTAAHNNSFYNLQVANWGTNLAAVGAFKCEGNRNYFQNCHFVAAGAPAYVLSDFELAGSNNTFVNCMFGTDTTQKSATEYANVLISGDGANNAADNMFNDCIFLCYHNATSASCIVSAGATSVMGGHYFRRCMFIGCKGGATPALAIDDIATLTATNAYYYCLGCAIYNISAWGGHSKVYIENAATAASAGGGIATTV